MNKTFNNQDDPFALPAPPGPDFFIDHEIAGAVFIGLWILMFVTTLVTIVLIQAKYRKLRAAKRGGNEYY